MGNPYEAARCTDEGRVSVDDTLSWIKREHLESLSHLAESGALKPVIDRCYPLEHIADAHRYVEQGHKKGNVILTMEPA